MLLQATCKTNTGLAGDWPKSTYLLLGTDSVSGTKGDAHMRLRKVLASALHAQAAAPACLSLSAAPGGRTCHACEPLLTGRPGRADPQPGLHGQGRGGVRAADRGHRAALLRGLAAAGPRERLRQVQGVHVPGGAQGLAGPRSEGFAPAPALTRPGRGGQVALEVILGFKKDAVDDALLTRCREAFRVWLQGLFSVPVDLPGFGAPLRRRRPCWLAACGCRARLPVLRCVRVCTLRGCLHRHRKCMRMRLSPGRPAVRSVPPGAQGGQAAARHPAQQPAAPEGRGGAPCVRTPANPPPLYCATIRALLLDIPAVLLPTLLYHLCTLASRAVPCLFDCAGPRTPACAAALAANVPKSKPTRPTHVVKSAEK